MKDWQFTMNCNIGYIRIFDYRGHVPIQNIDLNIEEN